MINPNSLIHIELLVKVHVICAGSPFINLKVWERVIWAGIDLGVEISILSRLWLPLTKRVVVPPNLRDMHSVEERMASSQSFKLGSRMLRPLAQLI